jgi:fido (protein-threonine AMPylation protein)
MGHVPDPYLLPNGVLRNKLHETDAETLATREAQYVAARTMELKGRPHNAPSTMARLQDIHHHLFQDVYDWAGKFRRVNLAKAYFEGESGQTRFVSAEYITSQAAEIDRWIQEPITRYSEPQKCRNGISYLLKLLTFTAEKNKSNVKGL